MTLSIPSKFYPVTGSNDIEEMRQRLELQHITEYRLLQDYKASVDRETIHRRKIKEMETSLNICEEEYTDRSGGAEEM